MVLEVVEIEIPPGTHARFEDAIRRGIDAAIAPSAGFLGYELQRGIEVADRYLLLIRWRTLEDHTQGFRQSPAFAQWRAIVGEFFARPPSVLHFETVSGP